jgi:hypothetical protein
MLTLLAMSLDPEFKKHLHSLFVEVAEETSNEIGQYEREILWKARQTHNSAAVPAAYMNAKLHAIETRVGKTLEKYIEAVAIWGIPIDAAFEREMISQFTMLTAGPNQLHFPPMLKGPHVQAVQGSFARERLRLTTRLIRQGTNRLRELKMKTAQANRAATSTTNNIFNAPVGNAYINSVVQTSNFTITAPILQDIDRVSEGHPELQIAALEIRSAENQGAGVLEKFQKWAGLLNAVGGLAERVHQHYPQIEALFSHLRPPL